MAQTILKNSLLIVNDGFFILSQVFWKKCSLGVDDSHLLGHNTEPKMAM